ncbi:hypothetical protein J7K25_05220 [bacterium]|nr:hypothetical protein [bacterium]
MMPNISLHIKAREEKKLLIISLFRLGYLIQEHNKETAIKYKNIAGVLLTKRVSMYLLNIGYSKIKIALITPAHPPPKFLVIKYIIITTLKKRNLLKI